MTVSGLCSLWKDNDRGQSGMTDMQTVVKQVLLKSIMSDVTRFNLRCQLTQLENIVFEEVGGDVKVLSMTLDRRHQSS